MRPTATADHLACGLLLKPEIYFIPRERLYSEGERTPSAFSRSAIPCWLIPSSFQRKISRTTSAA